MANRPPSTLSMGKTAPLEASSSALTTVAPDLSALADQTLDALIRRIEGDRTPGREYVVPHRLVVRQSTGG